MSTSVPLARFPSGSFNVTTAVDFHTKSRNQSSSKAADPSQQALRTAPLLSSWRSRDAKGGAFSPRGGCRKTCKPSLGLPHDVAGFKASSFGVKNRTALMDFCASIELAGSRSTRSSKRRAMDMMSSGVVQSQSPAAVVRAAARSPATSRLFVSSSASRAVYAAWTEIVPSRRAGSRMGSPAMALALFRVATDTPIIWAASSCEIIINGSRELLVCPAGRGHSAALSDDLRDLPRGASRFPIGSPPPTGRPSPRTTGLSALGAEGSGLAAVPTSSGKGGAVDAFGAVFGFPASPPLLRVARPAAISARCEVRLSSNGCGWVEARSAGRRGVLAVHLTGGGRGAPWPGVGRSGVAAGRPACQRATRVLRCAAALRVTHRPSLRSSSRYGPCGPAWTGRPGRPRQRGKARRLAVWG